MAIGLAMLVVSVGGGIGYSHVLERRQAVAAYRALPPSERNLAVFDAACALIEEHYFNREFLATDGWRQHKAFWRDKAASEQPGLLYQNVLANFAAPFPDSHVAFALPAQPEKLVMEMFAEAKAALASRPPVPEGKRAETAARASKLVKAFMSSPGFFMPRIRRGDYDGLMVDGLIRASAAERAGISPGWMMTHMTKHLTSDSARFVGNFLDLGPDGLRQFEKSGQLPGADTPERRTAYIEANTFTVEFELEELQPLPDFETRQLPGGITYLRFDGFTPSWLLGGGLAAKAMKVIDHAGPGGLILDLRNNHRGKLIGRITNGSVVFGNKFDLPDGGELMVPVRDFLRVDERRIEGIGVEPDIWIVPTLEDVRAGRDPVLERALQELGASI